MYILCFLGRKTKTKVAHWENCNNHQGNPDRKHQSGRKAEARVSAKEAFLRTEMESGSDYLQLNWQALCCVPYVGLFASLSLIGALWWRNNAEVQMSEVTCGALHHSETRTHVWLLQSPSSLLHGRKQSGHF